MQDLFSNAEKSFGPSPHKRLRTWGLGLLGVAGACTVVGVAVAWPAVDEASSNLHQAWTGPVETEELDTEQVFAPVIGPEVSGDLKLSELDASLQDPLNGGAASPCKDTAQMSEFVTAELNRLQLTTVAVKQPATSAACSRATLDAATKSVTISANTETELPLASRLDDPMVDGLLTLTTQCLTGPETKDKVMAELRKSRVKDATPQVNVIETMIGSCARVDLTSDESASATVWLPTGG